MLPPVVWGVEPTQQTPGRQLVAQHRGSAGVGGFVAVGLRHGGRRRPQHATGRIDREGHDAIHPVPSRGDEISDRPALRHRDDRASVDAAHVERVPGRIVREILRQHVCIGQDMCDRRGGDGRAIGRHECLYCVEVRVAPECRERAVLLDRIRQPHRRDHAQSADRRIGVPESCLAARDEVHDVGMPLDERQRAKVVVAGARFVVCGFGLTTSVDRRPVAELSRRPLGARGGDWSGGGGRGHDAATDQCPDPVGANPHSRVRGDVRRDAHRDMRPIESDIPCLYAHGALDTDTTPKVDAATCESTDRSRFAR